MFKKLELPLTDLDLTRLKGPLTGQYGPTFFEYSIADKAYLKNIITSRIKFHIVPKTVLVTTITSPGAFAHTDRWRTALNYYFDAGQDTTYFYREKNLDSGSAVREIKIYDHDNLEVLGTFTANQGESYLLDTHTIHSVSVDQSRGSRTMLRFTWEHDSFTTVLDSIELI